MANMLADRLLNADEEILFHRTVRPATPKNSASSAPPIPPAPRRIG
jgi:hypothetical protein